MFEILLWVSAVVLVGSMLAAYRRFHDPLHPIMYLGPMFLYLHVFIPLAMDYRDMIVPLFRSEETLELAQFAVTLQLSALAAGLLVPRIPKSVANARHINIQLSPIATRRMAVLSYTLGFVGLIAYFYRLSTVGGFFLAYSRPKGGGAISGLSGYITGASLLTIPAIILLVISRKGRKLDFRTAALMALFVAPHLLQGLLGGSRGNAFLALATLALGWYLAKAKRPPLRTLFAGLMIVGVLMFFLKTHRRTLYLGAEGTEISVDAVMDAIMPSDIEPSNVTPLTWGTIIAVRHHQQYFWGQRYAAQMFVRPIPRQLWPTKYEDMGLGWMVNQPGSAGMHPNQWIAALGWFPPAGAAVGLIGDAFLELAWGGILVCFLIGYLYAWLWQQAVMKHGLWTILYFEACVVSVYLPTQGLATAWLYRFAYLAVPSIILWRLLFKKHDIRVSRPTPAPPKIINRILSRMRWQKHIH